MTERERRDWKQADVHARISTVAEKEAKRISDLALDLGEHIAIAGSPRGVSCLALLHALKSEIVLSTSDDDTRAIFLEVFADLLKNPVEGKW